MMKFKHLKIHNVAFSDYFLQKPLRKITTDQFHIKIIHNLPPNPKQLNKSI